MGPVLILRRALSLILLLVFQQINDMIGRYFRCAKREQFSGCREPYFRSRLLGEEVQIKVATGSVSESSCAPMPMATRLSAS